MVTKQHWVRAPEGDELERIRAELRRMNTPLSEKQVRRVLYATSLVYGNCDTAQAKERERRENPGT